MKKKLKKCFQRVILMLVRIQKEKIPYAKRCGRNYSDSYFFY